MIYRISPRHLTSARLRGFTLVELLTVIAIIGILAAIIIPVTANVRRNARQSACLSNLRQIGTANLLYTADHKGILNHQQWGNSTSTANWTGTWKSRIKEYIVSGAESISDSEFDKLPLFRCKETPSDLQGGDTVQTMYLLSSMLVDTSDSTQQPGTSDPANPGKIRGGIPLRMNAFNFPSRKVQMIEGTGATKTLFQGNAFGMYDNSNGPGVIDFRHNNKTNVLFIDGHVETLGVPPLPRTPGPGLADASKWMSPTALP